jgi:signal peptidase II
MQRYAHFLIILPVFLLDRWTKILVIERLPFRDGIPIFSWFSIVHWHNTGGLFGFMAGNSFGKYMFLLLPIAIIAGLIYYLIAYRLPFWARLGLTLVLSGAIGNMYDRIFYGYVVDFLDVSFRGHHWPAFNVADSAISAGICLWLLTQLCSGRQQPGKSGMYGR